MTDLSPLSQVSDEDLYEETATRLRNFFLETTGQEFKFGRFEFIFHNGRFQGIDERPNARCYFSRERVVQKAPSHIARKADPHKGSGHESLVSRSNLNPLKKDSHEQHASNR